MEHFDFCSAIRVKVSHSNSKWIKVTKEVSFKDKAIGKQTLPAGRVKSDLVEQKLARVELVNGNRLTPMVHVDRRVLEELIKSWKEELVVKLVGKTLGFNLMKRKLASTWKVLGDFEIMDVGNGYYMVLFNDNEDRMKVINVGPWMMGIPPFGSLIG